MKFLVGIPCLLGAGHTLEEIIARLEPFGFKLLYQNAENIICAK